MNHRETNRLFDAIEDFDGLREKLGEKKAHYIERAFVEILTVEFQAFPETFFNRPFYSNLRSISERSP